MLRALTLDQLLTVVTVVDVGSFSAAGRKLGRVQSAISQSVKALEMSHGVQIFDRSGHTARLTEAGVALVAQAREVLLQAEAFKRTAGAIAAGVEAELAIAIDAPAPSAPLIRALDALRTQFPDLMVTLFTEGLNSAVRRVRAGTAFLGVCTIEPAAAHDLNAFRLTEIALAPVVAPSHPLAAEPGPVSRDLLARHVQLILTDPVSTEGSDLNVIGPRVWRFVDGVRRLEVLLAGFGWGNVATHMVLPHIAAGSLKRLEIDDAAILPGAMSVYAVHHRARPLGPASRWFIQTLQDQDWSVVSAPAVR